jgi:hypothetical protein
MMEKEVKVEKRHSGAPAAPNICIGYKGTFKPAASATVQPPKFEGKCDLLKGFVFD